jgi:ABC-type dipeptide/oligopeptide/nickel transport system ATPase component
MRQRVMIAIALACNPDLIIADEPTTDLDVTIQAQILDLIRELKEKKNLSLILITHDIGLVSEICEDIVVMYAGYIVEQGKTQIIINDSKHPYTKKLIESVPFLDRDITRLSSMKVSSDLMIFLMVALSYRCDYRIDNVNIKCHQ